MDENDIELINLVTQYEELINISNIKYSDEHHKLIVWNHIGNQLKTDPIICKERWQSIRDHLYTQRKRTNAGQPIIHPTNSRYGNKLAFLKPHCYFERRIDNTKEDSSSNEEYYTNTDHDHESNRNKT